MLESATVGILAPPKNLAMTGPELEALRLSLSVALRSVLASLPLAIAIAWLLTRRRFAGRTFLDAFVHLPLVLPPVVVGYLLLLTFGMPARNSPISPSDVRRPSGKMHTSWPSRSSCATIWNARS